MATMPRAIHFGLRRPGSRGGFRRGRRGRRVCSGRSGRRRRRRSARWRSRGSMSMLMGASDSDRCRLTESVIGSLRWARCRPGRIRCPVTVSMPITARKIVGSVARGAHRDDAAGDRDRARDAGLPGQVGPGRAYARRRPGLRAELLGGGGVAGGSAGPGGGRLGPAGRGHLLPAVDHQPGGHDQRGHDHHDERRHRQAALVARWRGPCRFLPRVRGHRLR